MKRKQTCDDNYLVLLHINLRVHIAHIATVTIVIKGIVNDLLLVTLSETLLINAIKKCAICGLRNII